MLDIGREDAVGILRVDDPHPQIRIVLELPGAVARHPLDLGAREQGDVAFLRLLGSRDHVGRGRHRLDEPAVALLARGEGVLGPADRPPIPGFPEFPLDGREETMQVVLQDVVVGARPERLDDLILAHRSGDHDACAVEAMVDQGRDRVRSRQARDDPVADHEIPVRVVRERVDQPRRRPDPAGGHDVPTPLELAEQELLILVGVLDEEDAKLPAAHRSTLASPTYVIRPWGPSRGLYARTCVPVALRCGPGPASTSGIARIGDRGFPTVRQGAGNVRVRSDACGSWSSGGRVSSGARSSRKLSRPVTR